MESVLYSVDGSVARVTLNRPETYNAMNDSLMAGLGDALARVEADESIRVLVITGAGKAFCSGADLVDLAASMPAADDPGVAVAGRMDTSFHPPIRALAACPVPTIARVNGVAAGGGIGLALGCDFAIAARSATFVSTFGPRLGIVPDLGTTWHLPARIGRARALGMAMLGDRISADDAAEWGLIWRSVDDDDLDGAVDELAARLAVLSPDAMYRIRCAIDGAADHTLSEHLDVERDHQVALIPRNAVAAAAAFVAKQEPEFPNLRTDRS